MFQHQITLIVHSLVSAEAWLLTAGVIWQVANGGLSQ